jgi:hypothetical protein
MPYHPKWLSFFTFSDCNITSTNSLSPPGPLHLCSDDLFIKTALETHTVEELLLCNFLFPSSLAAFCYASHPTLSALRGYKNFQPDKPVAFNLPCAKRSCLTKDRVFCDVVPFCLTEPNFSEDPAAISVDYLKDGTCTIKRYHS